MSNQQETPQDATVQKRDFTITQAGDIESPKLEVKNVRTGLAGYVILSPRPRGNKRFAYTCANFNALRDCSRTAKTLDQAIAECCDEIIAEEVIKDRKYAACTEMEAWLQQGTS